MGSTTRFGITYPELSATPDGPSQMQTMADTIETALGEAVDDVAGLTAGRGDLIFNGNFRINQEAAASYTATAASGKYACDGWYIYSGTGATNVMTPTAETVGTYADHDRYYMAWNRSVAGSADSYYEHRREDVRSASGSSVTVAILADVASGTASLKVEVVQNFGTGGSPSATVTTTTTAITLSTSNTSQYVTIAVPSISGKTLGTNEDHYVTIRLTRESGYGTGIIRLHRVGVTLGTAHVWPDKRPRAVDLDIAQRFYETGSSRFDQYAHSGTLYGILNYFRVTKRIAPTISQTNTSATNFGTTPAAGTITVDNFMTNRVATGTGGAVFAETWTASARL